MVAALGLSPTSIGDANYVIGSPIFPEVRPHLPGGKPFTIRALDSSDRNPYIQSATFNGQRYEHPWIAHADIVAGGELVLQMAAAPNADRGGGAALAPPSLRHGAVAGRGNPPGGARDDTWRIFLGQRRLNSTRILAAP